MQATTANKQIGNNIKRARSALGLSQRGLAHAIGYKGDNAGAYISRIEAQKQEPRLNTLNRIAKVLKVSLESLLAKPKRK